MPVSLARLLVFAEQADARDLIAVLAAISGTAPPPWTRYSLPDGTETESATVPVGGTEIVVLPGEQAAPIEIELATDRPLDEVLDDVIAVHGSASSAPNDPDAEIETATAHVGAVTVKVTAIDELAPFLMARLGEAEIAGETVNAAFWRGSLRHVRNVQGEMARLQADVLAVIPERERGALSAMAVDEGMTRMQAAVDAAVAEAKRVSAEILEEDQRRREADRGRE